jgi:hypothetical protein
MKPVHFREVNKVYAKDQPQYLSLPVYENSSRGGMAIHCWKLSFLERMKIILKGKLWITVLNFGEPLQPIKPTVDKPLIS